MRVIGGVLRPVEGFNVQILTPKRVSLRIEDVVCYGISGPPEGFDHIFEYVVNGRRRVGKGLILFEEVEDLASFLSVCRKSSNEGLNLMLSASKHRREALEGLLFDSLRRTFLPHYRERQIWRRLDRFNALMLHPPYLHMNWMRRLVKLKVGGEITYFGTSRHRSIYVDYSKKIGGHRIPRRKFVVLRGSRVIGGWDGSKILNHRDALVFLPKLDGRGNVTGGVMPVPYVGIRPELILRVPSASEARRVRAKSILPEEFQKPLFLFDSTSPIPLPSNLRVYDDPRIVLRVLQSSVHSLFIPEKVERSPREWLRKKPYYLIAGRVDEKL